MNTDYRKELNNEQYEAVTTTEGPVLVLAGAGTGKTRVITYRIAYIIKELNVAPGNILAVTFTNKAAGEMKERLHNLVSNLSGAVWMGTFHSICLTILRRDGYRIGLPASFGIVDQEDRLNIVRHAMKEVALDVKKYPPKQYLHAISAFKNTDDYVNNSRPEESLVKFGAVYAGYQEELVKQKIIDFDDMLGLAVRLFLADEACLNEYRELFKYILVDEYQDTNSVQFKLLYLLAGKGGNICVVGDDDQSIYGWRGAEVRNILEFDQVFDNVTEIKLIGNYRSGSDILDKANNLIENNRYRRGKILKACTDKVAMVERAKLSDERAEAEFVADIVFEAEKDCKDLSNIAVLYRTNAQSRNFEVALNKRRIAYKVIGGIGFYQRREIKDILSYLRVFDNRFDSVSFRRSLKNPGRGVGDATIDKIVAYSSLNGVDLIEALGEAGSGGRSGGALKGYIDIIIGLSKIGSIKEKIDFIVEQTNYNEYLKQFEEPDEASKRIDNVRELFSAAAAFEEQESGASLSDFLANTALISSSDESSGKGTVKLMTMHAAKGLEFKTVFLTGLEEGLFPLGSAEGEANIEEERRLCYVGITRAMEELYITNVVSRLQYGRRQLTAPSRFLRELGIKSEPKFSGGSNTYTNIGGSYADYTKKDAPVTMNYGSSNKGATFSVAAKVVHAVFGEGVVVGSEGSGATEKVTVQFKKSGIKKILAGFLNPR